ncbi:hypothetical protein NFI96_009143 [Prochilodus magdalenae]|nr:hypothetical protein NFI96_009143 [Prochilodus magdalenae]
MLRGRLVCGVSDDGIQRRLLAELDLTFQKALKTAQAVESANRIVIDLRGQFQEDLRRFEVDTGCGVTIMNRDQYSKLWQKTRKLQTSNLVLKTYWRKDGGTGPDGCNSASQQHDKVSTTGGGRWSSGPHRDLAISFGNSLIAPTEDVRSLGVILDGQLSFSAHIANLTRSCRFLLYNIRRIRPFLSQEAIQLLVQSLVISRLDYCNSLRAGLPLRVIRPLQLVQNAAARLIFNLLKFTHVTPLLRSLHWLPVVARIRFKTLKLAYKAKNGPAPPYLMAMVKSRSVSRALRASSTARLEPPSLRTHGRQASRLFSVLAPRWNEHWAGVARWNTTKPDGQRLVNEVGPTGKLTLEEWLENHSEVFKEEMDQLRGTTAHIHVDKEALPKFYKPRKDTEWKWGKEQETAFRSAKALMQTSAVLVHYDASEELLLACDASPYGVGAVLSHSMLDGSDRPTGFVSRMLSAAVKNYSQLDTEDLAVSCGVDGAYPLNCSTTSVTIECLRKSFSQHGIPETLVTDNGTCFTSSDFTEFRTRNGITHVTTAPDYALSNRLTERAVQTLKELLKKRPLMEAWRPEYPEHYSVIEYPPKEPQADHRRSFCKEGDYAPP